ncbi:leucine-rich repeat-containing protein 20 [Rhinatrema bivittatum]|uniref:leucine-rich repeat-containing protein 20 n=1 Tax=Rhinatrema bivittatum TaxID=194408 RepID=UPI00112A48AE|nr:leucine-rich repeat-containing protein 20 [Rhinatrema bivittatum]XP_029464905.1 leucine-rich repeat-containing protein 20 [Rhinatrema bivittatum]
MHKRMAEAVARVARKVNETVENNEDHLDLADCMLNAFPIAIYKVMENVTEAIHSISLANNEIKALTGKFFTTFCQLRELNLAGNCLHQLPEEAGTLQHLKVINLSRNKFQDFPQQLAALSTLETIDLEENQITDVPVEKLTSMKAIRCLNLKSNPLNSDRLALFKSLINFQLLTSLEEVPAAAQA